MVRTGSALDRRVAGAEVTGNYFRVLGIPVVVGRPIVPEDAELGERVAVLGHATSVREFGGVHDALGQTVRVDGQRYTVVGVAPPGLGLFDGQPIEIAVWIPLRLLYLENADWNVLLVAGRRRADAALPQVQAELTALAAGLAAADPDRWTDRGEAIRLKVMTERQARLEVVGGPRGVASIIIWFVFVGVIMAVACSNVAGLMLNRALRRRSEIAMRIALGASKGRLVRQILIESLLLFSLAGILALLLIDWGTGLLAAGWGAFLPVVADITVNARVTAFAIGVTVLSGVAFGMAPALLATRLRIAPTLRGRGEGWRPRRFGARNLFVLAQVAASMVLVGVSALFVRDVRQARHVDIGFDPSGIAVASLDLSHRDYGAEDGRIWLEMLTQHLERIPGVEGVELASWVPLSGRRWSTLIRPDGFELGPDETLDAVYNAVTPGYFRMVDMPLLSGRGFEHADDAEAPPVMIVNEAFVRRYWPDQEPIGKRVTLGSEDGTRPEVVGVVRDAMYGIADLRAREAQPHLWVPRAQSHHSPVQVHVRAAGTQGLVLRAMREEIRLLDEDLPIMALTTLESITENALLEERIAAMFFGGFSLLALLLAALGIYGVMAHAVMERTPELGVRLALGSSPVQVVRMILADSFNMAVLGIGVGLGLAVVACIGVRALLVGVSALDPVSLAGSAAVLTLATLLGGLVPAVRAARLDPVVSLKSE
jgi:predicted permease